MSPCALASLAIFQQRMKRSAVRARRAARVFDAVQSLGRPSAGPLASPHISSFPRPLNVAQQAAIDRVSMLASSYGDEPEGGGREAVQALLKTNDFYEFDF